MPSRRFSLRSEGVSTTETLLTEEVADGEVYEVRPVMAGLLRLNLTGHRVAITS
jgi:hypothetical protein